MVRLLKVFFSFRGANPWMVVLCLLCASVAQGFGFASLVPLISVIGDGSSQPTSLAGRTVVRVLGTVGLSANVETLLVVVVVAVLLKSALTVMAMVYVSRAVANVGNNLRERLIGALLKARWSYFTSKPTGTLINSVGLESSISGQLYLMISRYLSNFLQTAINVAVSFAVSWQLAAVSIIVGGLVVLSMHSLVRMADKAGRRNIRRSRELVTRLSDAMVGIKPLKAMAREDEFARLFTRKIDQIRSAVRREMISKNLLNNLQEPILMLMLAGGFYVVVEFWHMPIANVLVMGVLLQRTVQTIARVQAQYQEAVAAESAYLSVCHITAEADQQREPEFGTRIATFETGCAFRSVSFTYGRSPVLRDLSVEIPARRLTLLVGGSGTGKTTFTDLLLGLYRPDEGSIVIDGVPLSEIDVRSWRRSIGYVPQELSLLHDTILANITLGDTSLDEERVMEALRLAGAAEFIAPLPDGLATEVGEKGSRFSGGQRQRISLARALVHGPKLLILDEVTSALDAATEREICENIKEISKSVTVLAISHRQAWIDIADQVIYLRAATDDDESAG
ncbi:MAG: ABC transporter ATP-binding protein [Rhodospirillales bacterium]|nr:ABC transporter ATP-binding protein [Rhodospirillales bacterium]